MDNALAVLYFGGVGAVLEWLRYQRQPTWPVWVVGLLGAFAFLVAVDDLSVWVVPTVLIIGLATELALTVYKRAHPVKA